MSESGAQAAPTTRVDVTPDELQLIRAALELLETTLGREEADELREVQALLARLPVSAPA